MKVTYMKNINLDKLLADRNGGYLVLGKSGMLSYLKDTDIEWMPLYAENGKLNSCLIFADIPTVEKVCEDMETEYLPEITLTKDAAYRYLSEHRKNVFLHDPLYTVKGRLFYKGMSVIRNQIDVTDYIVDETKEMWWG